MGRMVCMIGWGRFVMPFVLIPRYGLVASVLGHWTRTLCLRRMACDSENTNAVDHSRIRRICIQPCGVYPYRGANTIKDGIEVRCFVTAVCAIMDSQHQITPLRVPYSTASPCHASWTMYPPVHFIFISAEPSTLSSTRRPQATPPTCRCTRVPTRQGPIGLYFVDSVPDRLSCSAHHHHGDSLFFGRSRQGMLGYRQQRNSEVWVVGN
jgi:hypothetical protein